jgi:hypothetical protein
MASKFGFKNPIGGSVPFIYMLIVDRDSWLHT